MSNKKERLDILLVENGLFDTREKAKRAVMAGLIYGNEERLEKPGEKVSRDVVLTIKGQTLPYVSRGGLKLEKAINEFDINVSDKIMIDIGSSTGGFTDCALQNGAKLSYALDVGYNQLAWKLRQDERVVVMERTNFRYVTPADFEKGMPEFASIDVSFISLRLIFPVLKTILRAESDVVALVKPQFEAGKEFVGKKGIVRDPEVHEHVLKEMMEFVLKEGYDIQNLSFSPITGGDGNIEFLLHIRWEGSQEKGTNHFQKSAKQVVEEAHATLKEKRQSDKQE
ncbi:TlyA family RNA methyltransferase [Metabacillus litoralis]|uniref:TlyA family RNA methyltransferase n=1 Tax=Metabacillus TaxID=2675233 RepID=UPI001B9DCAED|nr:TlyA family RNA methyltransferase [Metabacillus litoralis]MCM3161672.1 TlyA family RNA methyltransferase [Metabacillus litoralis]MCM3412505.1 TlyA family RNA methyltransferase [Metabacillus litoralis]UHA57963.1 TlyA family RNA methyltransferase [Metabacillus litoralis]